jgi:HAD superfamily hydrolase (TIGR01549 family)
MNPATMSLSLILFDLDETLFDHRHASRSALEVLKRDHPALGHVSVEDLAEAAYQILEQTHTRVLAGELTVHAARIERLRQLFGRFGASLEEPAYRQASAAHIEVYRRSRRAVAGARDLLAFLGRHYRIGIVTNNFRQEQESKLSDCGLTDVVDFMVTSEETGSSKPDAAIFRVALEHGQSAASEAVMVGDSWPVDIVGALRAGIRPVWFNRAGHPASSDPRVSEVRSFEPLDCVVPVILGQT